MTELTAAQQLATVRPANLAITKMIEPCGVLANLPCEQLDSGDLYFIPHETANTNSTAGGEFHARFVNSGGGSALVSFHFTVDKFGAWQMIPLDNVGFHAADGLDNRTTDIGGFRGIAIETCVNDPIGSAGWLQTKQNLVALMVAVLIGDGRIDYGTSTIDNFSPTRILPHIAVSDPSPDQHHCPDRMLNEGLIDAKTGRGILMDAVSYLYAAETNTTPAKPAYPPVVGLPFDLASATGWQKLNGLDVFMVTAEVEALKKVIPRTFASSVHAPQAADAIPVRGKAIIKAHFRTADKVEWFLLQDGSRARASSFNPRFTIKLR